MLYASMLKFGGMLVTMGEKLYKPSSDFGFGFSVFISQELQTIKITEGTAE